MDLLGPRREHSTQHAACARIALAQTACLALTTWHAQVCRLASPPPCSKRRVRRRQRARAGAAVLGDRAHWSEP